MIELMKDLKSLFLVQVACMIILLALSVSFLDDHLTREGILVRIFFICVDIIAIMATSAMMFFCIVNGENRIQVLGNCLNESLDKDHIAVSNSDAVPLLKRVHQELNDRRGSYGNNVGC